MIWLLIWLCLPKSEQLKTPDKVWCWSTAPLHTLQLTLPTNKEKDIVRFKTKEYQNGGTLQKIIERHLS